MPLQRAKNALIQRRRGVIAAWLLAAYDWNDREFLRANEWTHDNKTWEVVGYVSGTGGGEMDVLFRVAFKPDSENEIDHAVAYLMQREGVANWKIGNLNRMPDLQEVVRTVQHEEGDFEATPLLDAANAGFENSFRKTHDLSPTVLGNSYADPRTQEVWEAFLKGWQRDEKGWPSF